MRRFIPLIALAALGCTPTATNELGATKSPGPAGEVTVYVSVDQIHAERVLKAFEAKTGIKVNALYDVEAEKTVGLVQRLIAEKDKPKADVFWNGEFVQTVKLKNLGLFEAYKSPSAGKFPAWMQDHGEFYYGFAPRARVWIAREGYKMPKNLSMEEFSKLPDKGERLGMTTPLMGTGATHASALYALLGPEKTLQLFKDMKAKGVRVLEGNSVVKDKIASGEMDLGMVDTDDACVAIKDGTKLQLLYPDQEGLGTLVIPGTAGIIKGAKHRKEAEALIEFLLSPECEKLLVESGQCQMPVLNPDMKPCLALPKPKVMEVSAEKAVGQLERASKELREVISR